jgi:hypothetical protein
MMKNSPRQTILEERMIVVEKVEASIAMLAFFDRVGEFG